jgi:hypothetical protein
MGIAEAIAITMMVTAKNLAMESRFQPGLLIRPYHLVYRLVCGPLMQ